MGFVLLGEPPRSQYDLNFQIFGIPVRVHPWFWLIAVMLGIRGNPGGLMLLTWVVAVFVSILVHEMGHALVMRCYGIWPWITLYSFGGLASYNPGEARRVGWFGQVLISFAGPGSQFVLAAVVLAGVRIVGDHMDPIPPGLALLLTYLVVVSVGWGVLNLIPVYPLDGGQIAREICVAVSPRHGIRVSLILSIIAGTLVAGVALAHRAIFLGVMFGVLAYGSYTTLQAYRNQRGW